MKVAPVTRGGQVSIPADVRHRWRTNRVVIYDHGASLELRPLPDDPIAAVRGSMAGTGLSTDEVRALEREDDAARESRRAGG